MSNLEWTSDERLIYGLQRDDISTLLIITEPRSLRIDAESGFQSQIVSNDGASHIATVALSNNERFVAFDTTGKSSVGARLTFIFDRESGETVPLQTSDQLDTFGPAWSPDDRYLLVSHNEAGEGSGSPSLVSGLSLAPYQMLVEWQGVPIDIDVFSDARSVDNGGIVFNTDPGEASAVTGFRDQWFFGTPKLWVAD